MESDLLQRSWRAWLSKDPSGGGPAWLGLVWTLVFCLVVAAGFTVLGFAAASGKDVPIGAAQVWRWYQANVMISLVIGYAIHVLFFASIRLVGRRRLDAMRPWQRTAFYSGVPIVGVAIGWPLALLWVLGVDLHAWAAVVPGRVVLATALLFALITLVFHQFFRMKTRQIQAENRATEAQLRLLQAQIEPHFLFNTLANVVSLMDTDTLRAKSMLESFVDYLRASMPAFGRADAAAHTLGGELDLVEAYLRIVQTRMEDRLRFSIDVPAELRGVRLPPLTVQPLVENAVVHGLEPTLDGGAVRVTARRVDGAVVVTVADDGAGVDAAPGVATPRRTGAGTALANIRERLGQTYGRDASLSIAPGGVRGTDATLVIPAVA